MINLYNILYFVFNIYYYAIFIYIILSWFPIVRDSYLYSLFSKIIEPYLAIFRRFIPAIGNIDFSPVLALIMLRLLMVGTLSLVSTIL